MSRNIHLTFESGQPIRSSDFYYVIDSKIKQQGVQGESYLAYQKKYDDPTETNLAKVFIKIPKVDENLLGEEVRERMQKIHMTLSAEFENKFRFQNIEHVAKILDLTLYKQDDLENELTIAIPCLISQFVEGKAFVEYLDDTYCFKLNRKFRGIPNQKEWFSMARKLTEILRRIHNRHIVHGDIWLDNILIQPASEEAAEAQPWLIDFGQSFLVDRSYKRESHTNVTRPYWAPERKRGSWYSPADIY